MSLEQWEEQHQFGRLFDVKPSSNIIKTIISNRVIMNFAEVTDIFKLEK
jgi:hypothetical protein